MSAHELREMCTGNLMASYDSEESALDVVAETARMHGSSSVMLIALVRISDDADPETVATGADLLARQAVRGQASSLRLNGDGVD
jgi:hypothetical protein